MTTSEKKMHCSYVNDPTTWDVGDTLLFTCATHDDAKKAEALYNTLLARLAAAEGDAKGNDLDARRYRWLRADPVGGAQKRGDLVYRYGTHELDQRIDAAIDNEAATAAAVDRQLAAPTTAAGEDA